MRSETRQSANNQTSQKPLWSAEASRQIQRRVIVEGTLILQTPAHLGAGDSPDDTWIPLLVDPLDGQSPLLTGASIAGALRAHLVTLENGYSAPEARNGWAEYLFGAIHQEDDSISGNLSRLIVDDAVGSTPAIEVRSGVRIQGESRTAADGALYNHEVWAAGTEFPLRFELLLYENDPDTAIGALAAALHGLADGSIRIGARKRRGFGNVSVSEWRTRIYTFHSPGAQSELMAWLRAGTTLPAEDRVVHVDKNIFNALGVSSPVNDQRQQMTLEADFRLPNSLLIRTGDNKLATHLHSRRDNQLLPVLSGTSLAGALRARISKIAATLNLPDGEQIIAGLFGAVGNSPEATWASRILIDEEVIAGGENSLEQTRVAIDRFTGGAQDKALFQEKPVFGSEDTFVRLRLRLFNPQAREIGLILLALRDLWTGDLPLGGGSSIGRGRLQGIQAVLTINNTSLELRSDERGYVLLTDKQADELQGYVNGLWEAAT
jgi:CRISPR/Cas system CSM-associated protein Csm3 (group 7 of RAMP superfamily)